MSGKYYQNDKRQRSGAELLSRLKQDGYSGTPELVQQYMDSYLMMHDGVDDAVAGRAMAKDTIIGHAKALALHATRIAEAAPEGFGQIPLPPGTKGPEGTVAKLDAIFREAHTVFNAVFPEKEGSKKGPGL